MKKGWQKPTLDVLDVKMTMAKLTGSHYDGDYLHGQIPGSTSTVTDANGNVVTVPNVMS